MSGRFRVMSGRRRASVYAATVGCALIVTLIGVSGILAVRVQQRVVQDTGDEVAARWGAQSAVELGLLEIARRPDWRTRFTNGTWKSQLPLELGDYSVAVVDPGDGDLADSPCDPVLVIGTGRKGAARQRVQVELRADALDSDALENEILALGPVAYWRLGETSGTTAVDAVGTQNGTYRNGVALGDGVPFRCDPAPRFDGVNDFVEIPHHNAFLVANGSVHFWFKAPDVNRMQGLFCKDSAGYDSGGHLRIVLGIGQIHAHQQTTSADYESNASGLQPNTWYQVVLTFGSHGMILYLNGVPIDYRNYKGGLAGNTQPIAIGVDLQTAGDGTTAGWSDPFGGVIDEVAFFDYELWIADVANLYAVGRSEPPQTMTVVDGSWRPVVD